MKTLILVVHPHLNESLINKRWVEELQKHSDRYEVHPLYEAYPDGKIDVAAEQQLMERYERIVFQYPLYWFNWSDMSVSFFSIPCIGSIARRCSRRGSTRS